ncbi:MAG: Fic family protein [Zoogloeaceae bacterium]|nr:Fic family protein [Zoogloeaceae bacterium]
MKLPLNPPSFESLFRGLRPDLLQRLLKHRDPLVDGRYLHWDELRHRTPPEGVSSEQWWLAIRLARNALLSELPLFDKDGRPFSVAIPDPVQIRLYHLDQDAAGQLRVPDGLNIDENNQRYLLHSLREEAITSSQLEGASTTRRVAEAMLRDGRKPRDRSEAMIYNNYQAMNHLRGLKGEPITPDRILELHSMLTINTLDDPAGSGQLRRDDEVRVTDNRDGALLHQPPSHLELPARLERLCAFANQSVDTTPFVHPAVRAILLHFMVGYDHPFVDGNGRTARALFYWAMARSGYWLTEFLSISQFLRRAPRQYVQAYLHTETDGGDTTYFVVHQLDTLNRAIDSLHDYLAGKTKEKRANAKLVAIWPALNLHLNSRQLALINHALNHPHEAYRMSSHQKAHQVVYQTARTDLLGLEELGLLDRTQEGKAFVFYAPENLRERLARVGR